MCVRKRKYISKYKSRFFNSLSILSICLSCPINKVSEVESVQEEVVCRFSVDNIIMGEGESANVVSNTDSNGNCLPGKTLNGVSEKKDLEGDQGKASGDNGVKDLKEDVIKEMEEDQKAGGEVKHNNEVDDEEEVKEDKEIGSVEGKKEDNKDDNVFESEKLNEEAGVKETVYSKEEKENVEAKKPDLDVMEAMDAHKGKNESSEKETIREEEKSEDKVDKPKDEEKVEDSKIEIGLIKFEKGKNIGEKVISKRQETVDSKGEKESAEAKKPEVVVMEEVAVPEDKDERRKKNKVQEEEDEDKINKLKEEEKVDDSKVEKELRKHSKGKINGEKVKRKRKETVHSEKEKESAEAKTPELDAMDEEGVSKDKDESSEKEKFQEEGKEEDEEKGSKKYRKGKINREKVEGKREVLKETESRTPAISRPVRERKTVERLVTSIEKDANKELHIAKGRGTPLKDIPNVTFKLSRRKTDDTLKLLHTVLFGRRGKAIQVKSNISRFSGFVWRENEEKQM
ncbi:PREDICTED: ABC transporter F family member 4-like, partial [Lupinus angustifolius]|uniref:ABC transporter F family member 4-like n=1 Tax=Lupinus angustifolius TaxID=3871 RepID=UPI00092FC725